MNFLSIFTLIISLYIADVSGGINWNGNNWAMSCDFKGNDLTNVRIKGEECGGKCAHTNGCTHFTWTTYNGGTCWLKKGPASKSSAFQTHDTTMVCGVIHETPGHRSSSGIDMNQYWGCCTSHCGAPTGGINVIINSFNKVHQKH